jgi:DeoR/GlpR family transcriptional regulator of sugar metabolism
MVREEFHERSFGESARIHQPEKAAIARAALAFVPSGGVVFLDAGTTCLALARLLASSFDSLTVVTRGLEAALLLARTPVSVVVVGGSVRPLSHGVVGPLASVAFDRLAFDAAFLGADQVSPDRGLGEPTVEETFVKEQAAARASEVYVLADASKMEAASVPAWIPIPPEWTLVTDRAAPESVVEGFRGRGVPVVLAD